MILCQITSQTKTDTYSQAATTIQLLGIRSRSKQSNTHQYYLPEPVVYLERSSVVFWPFKHVEARRLERAMICQSGTRDVRHKAQGGSPELIGAKTLQSEHESVFLSDSSRLRRGWNWRPQVTESWNLSGVTERVNVSEALLGTIT